MYLCKHNIDCRARKQSVKRAHTVTETYLEMYALFITFLDACLPNYTAVEVLFYK